MRVAVVSDTHGRSDTLARALRQAGHVDLLLHCGDGERDCDALADFSGQILRVRGNCDLASAEPDDRLLRLPGATIYMAHGHLLDAKNTLYRLWARGRETQADFVCFGHTHTPLLDRQGGLSLLNPGSLRYGQSYALIELRGGKADVRLKSLKED